MPTVLPDEEATDRRRARRPVTGKPPAAAGPQQRDVGASRLAQRPARHATALGSGPANAGPAPQAFVPPSAGPAPRAVGTASALPAAATRARSVPDGHERPARDGAAPLAPLSAGTGRTATLCAGTSVEVRNRFVGTWSRGFEVAEHLDGRYRLRRLSDGCELPGLFDPSEVRSAADRSPWT